MPDRCSRETPGARWWRGCWSGFRWSGTELSQSRAAPRSPAPSARASRISARMRRVATSILLRRDHMRGVENALIVEIGFVRIFTDPLFNLVTEMRDQALDRPGRRVAKRTNGVALDLLGHFQKHVDLALVGAAFGHPGQHPPHPARALAAGRALATALVLVEIGDAGNGTDQIRRLVHHDDGRGAEARAQLAEAVEIHRRIDDLFGRHHPHRGATGDYGLEIVPAAANAAAMLFDQFAERNAHRLFDVTGPFDVAGNTKQLGADIVGPADGGEPGRAAPQDVGSDRNRLDVVDRGRATIKTDIGRERWL